MIATGTRIDSTSLSVRHLRHRTINMNDSEAAGDTSSSESEVESLKAQLESFRQSLRQKDQELEALRHEYEEVTTKLEDSTTRTEELERQLEDTQLGGKLRMLRALEELRVEHKRILDEEGQKRTEDSTCFKTLS